MQPAQFVVHPIGYVESSLVDRGAAPNQADEGAPEAWLVFSPQFTVALRDLRTGDEIVVLTWLDRAQRDVLAVHPRGDRSRPLTGVFSTRSPDRPNPIGLHRVTIQQMNGLRMQVGHLEALNGTPILDIKPVLNQIAER